MQKTTFSLLLLLFISFSALGQSQATYNITFNSIWNATDHTSVPGSAHWSRLVGATHKTANTFLQLGGTATTGIKNVAEFGSNTVFNTEVNAQITANEADQYINGPSLGSGPGNIFINDLKVDFKYPLLTLVSMIAPSPDWIIAVNGYNLLDGSGDWKTSVTLDLFAYDAGTDNGSDYTSSNIAATPFQPISMINMAPISGNKMGTLTITLQSVLSVDDVDPLSTVSVYPNPSVGNIKISNPNRVDLKNIEVYNILGKMVASSTINSNGNYDFSNLNKGVYILKLQATDNKVKTQKLVIQ
jgi:hypothetical protein